MEVHAFLSFNIAVLLLILGKAITLRSDLLRRYSIPEPVVGGFLCAAFVAGVYFLFDRRILFQLEVRDFLLLLFFAGIGLKSDVGTLLRGGRPLVILLVLATVFMVGQNAVGMSVASLFGLDPLAGLMVGSVSLTGGVGTTVAWAPTFRDELGIANAMELGVASNTVGLIAACVIGGPMAAFLMRRNGIETSGSAALDIGAAHDATPPLDYFSVLWAMLILNVTVLLGAGIDVVIARTGLMLPTFVSCLIAGILLRNLMPIATGEKVRALWPGISQGLALISDIALGLFLTMALMGLQLWELAGVFGFIVTALAIQIALTAVFTILVVFRTMGRDYEAAVISAGFGGITLGSTATAIANMTAVTQQYGAAHRAFIIVPLVCGFFIDIVNALVIAAFIG
ncbi:glutamate permease [Aureimonas altamirensis]|uniref:Sodium/glutamate symporter n=1 Tax=Aureimonas altamirensis TaxID=370622 RepID=A0A0B1Q0K4_9HYPH|nr:sodium/glutamate symporter [Aureimonas altamirensis]KHJ53894.1 glutamate permease [Aureimonas altamirensis]